MDKEITTDIKLLLMDKYGCAILTSLITLEQKM